MERPRTESSEPTLRESKSALLEAAQAAVAEQRARHHGEPTGSPFERGRRTVFRTLLAIIGVAGTVLLIIRPAWLAGPTLPPEPAAIRAASATLALVEVVSHVRAFKQIRGRLPRALAEIGLGAPDVRYEPMGPDEFTVSLVTGDSTVRIRSTDSLKQLVVSAILTLQRRS